MREHFKKHLMDLVRIQTSEKRDLKNGLRLDRNERVTNFSDEVREDLVRNFPSYALSSYPNTSNFIKRLSSWLKRSPSEVYVFNGVTEGIRILFETLTDKGDNILIITPTYPMYSVYMKVFRLNPIQFGFIEKNNKQFELDLSSLYQKITPEIKMLVLANPNLPIESNVSLRELSKIASKCQEHDVIFVVDEAYCLLGAETAIPLVDEFRNVVVMQSYSKAFGLAGIRFGHMISQAENISYLSKTRSIVETDAFTLYVAQYFLDHIWIMKKYVEEVKKGGKYLQQELTTLGLKWFGGDVTNAILIFLEDQRIATKVDQILFDKKIYVRKDFSKPFDCCLRVTIGPRAEMQRLINVLKEV